MSLGVPAHSVRVQRVPCNLTSTAIFKRLEGKCVRNNHIIPCAEFQSGDGILIQDRLRSVGTTGTYEETSSELQTSGTGTTKTFNFCIIK